MSRTPGITPEKPEQAQAFELWYQERNFSKLSEITGRPKSTLYVWADNYDWFNRAQERDKKVQEQIETKAMREKVKRVQDQLQIGTALRQRGTQYIAAHPVDDARTALAFIKVGVEIERAADGLPDLYLAIANAQTIEELDALTSALQPDSSSATE